MSHGLHVQHERLMHLSENKNAQVGIMRIIHSVKKIERFFTGE